MTHCRSKSPVNYRTMYYVGVTEEKASEDIDKFLNTLSANNILDDGIVRGKIAVQVPAKDDRR